MSVYEHINMMNDMYQTGKIVGTPVFGYTIRQTPILKMQLLVNEPNQNKDGKCFKYRIPVVTFRDTAIQYKNMQDGQVISIHGYMTSFTHTRKGGFQYTTMEVVAQQIEIEDDPDGERT